MGLGKREAAFGAVLGVGLEEVIAVDDAAEGIGGDLAAVEVALLDAGAVEGLDIQ